MVYVDDMAVIGRSLQAVSEVIQQMEEPALTIGLDINVDKTKSINTSRSRQQDAHTRTVDINGKVYHEVTDFKYLRSIITSDNNCERLFLHPAVWLNPLEDLLNANKDEMR
jgi:hypothetical protein